MMGVVERLHRRNFSAFCYSPHTKKSLICPEIRVYPIIFPNCEKFRVEKRIFSWAKKAEKCAQHGKPPVRRTPTGTAYFVRMTNTDAVLRANGHKTLKTISPRYVNLRFQSDVYLH